jgi:hypothetical protein
VTANIHGNLTTAAGTLSTVLLYDPVPSNNPGSVGGGRSLNIMTDTGAVEHDGFNTPSSNKLTWGAGSTLAVDAGAFPGVGALNFTRTAGTTAAVSVGAGATLLVNSGATVNLGGTQDALSDGTNDVDVTNNSATGLNITADNKNVGTVSGSGTTTVNSSTSLTATAVRQGTLNANGNVTIRPNGTTGGAGGVSNINNLTLGPSVRFDIGNNKLVTKNGVGSAVAGTYNGVSGLIQSGRNGGGWGGNGIVTSQSTATTSNVTSIGVATASQVKSIASGATATWAGQTVTGSDTLVMYTYGGDANLDGKINVDDYGRIDFNVNLGVAGWYNGDFNYDGKINVDDYGIIDFNVGIQGAPFFTAGGSQSASGLSGVSAVPEPATLGVLAVGAMGLAARRRRRAK